MLEGAKHPSALGAPRPGPAAGRGIIRAGDPDIVAGLVSTLFGVVLFARHRAGGSPSRGCSGLFTLIYGFSQITMGIEVRRASKAVDSAMKTAA